MKKMKKMTTLFEIHASGQWQSGDGFFDLKFIITAPNGESETFGFSHCPEFDLTGQFSIDDLDQMENNMEIPGWVLEWAENQLGQ